MKALGHLASHATDSALSGARHRWRLKNLDVELLPDGAAFLPSESMLVVADLHLEKGVAFAARGSLLPPHETLDTLSRLHVLLDRVAPQRLLLLGDSFHSEVNSFSEFPAVLATIEALHAKTELIWISGNHDPSPPLQVPGVRLVSLDISDVRLRHAATDDGRCEIVGHHHPSAALATRAGRLRRKCFLASGKRLMLPAFGELTGGLDARTHIATALFPDDDAQAILINGNRLVAVPVSALA